MSALSCRPCSGLTWPARTGSGCECLRKCGSRSCTATLVYPIPPVEKQAKKGHQRASSPEMPAPADRVRLFDAAQLAGVAPSDLTLMAAHGIAPKRYGTLGVFDRAELVAWIAGWSR